MKTEEAFAMSQMVNNDSELRIMGQKTLDDGDVGLAIYNFTAGMGILIWSVEDWNTMVKDGTIKPKKEKIPKNPTYDLNPNKQKTFAMLIHLNEKRDVEELAKKLDVTNTTMKKWLKKEQDPNKSNRKKIAKLYSEELNL